jgi:hypothetical protein
VLVGYGVLVGEDASAAMPAMRANKRISHEHRIAEHSRIAIILMNDLIIRDFIVVGMKGQQIPVLARL